MRARALVVLVVAALASCSSGAAHDATSTSRSTPSSTSSVSSTTTLAPAVEPIGTVTHGTITFAGRPRTYRLYVPSSFPAGPVPLLVALHGGGGWGDQFASTNHVEGLAESNGFLVVHPDGISAIGGRGEEWNGGDCCALAAREKIDDVGFIRALLDTLERDHAIDPRRVFAFGHSNGAIMSYRLACELADRIDAIGMWAGVLGVDTCTPAKPVSVIQGHGTADGNILITGGGGPYSNAGVDFPPPHEGFDTLAGLDGCPAPKTSSAGDIKTELRGPCKGGAAAEFVTITGADHAWPGGTTLRTPAGGAAYTGWDATAEIVAFLLAHPRR